MWLHKEMPEVKKKMGRRFEGRNVMSLDKNNILKNIINDGYGWDEEGCRKNVMNFYKKYDNIFQLENIDSLTPEKYREFWKDGYIPLG